MDDKETCPYCQSRGLVFVPIDANYGERRCASCGAVHSVMQIEDHAELARLRAELAAMTARKDGWRRVARMLHGDIHEALDNELYEYATDHYAWKRDWSCHRRIERREARNG